MFRFYVGALGQENQSEIKKRLPEQTYHLVDLADSSSTNFEIATNGSSAPELHFLIGIDSADQNRGAQKGVLDPLKGMYWTWNSGYLSFKIEGSSPASALPAHLIAYHIGGYRTPYSTIWKIKLIPDSLVRSSDDRIPQFEIPIELDYFFDGPLAIHIGQNPDCTTPGELARKISLNFASTFKGINRTENP